MTWRTTQYPQGPTYGFSACVVQWPSGFTFTSARAALTPAPPPPPAPALDGTRLAASRFAARRSCRDGAISRCLSNTGGGGGLRARRRMKDELYKNRLGFTRTPFASRNGRRAGRHAECHAHVWNPVDEGTCRCAHAGRRAICSGVGEPAQGTALICMYRTVVKP
jgi:hypothetical protein